MIELTGWLLGAQLFDLFSGGELRRFAWLIALVIAAITVARRRVRPAALSRPVRGERRARQGARHLRARSRRRPAHRHARAAPPPASGAGLSIAAIAAVLFGGLASRCAPRPTPRRGRRIGASRSTPPRALYPLNGSHAPPARSAPSCEASPVRSNGPPATAGGCRLRAFVALARRRNHRARQPPAPPTPLFFCMDATAHFRARQLRPPGRRGAARPGKAARAHRSARRLVAMDLTSPSGSPYPAARCCASRSRRARPPQLRPAGGPLVSGDRVLDARAHRGARRRAARLFPGRVSTTPPDRVAYARDLWPRGLIGIAPATPRRIRPTRWCGRRRPTRSPRSCAPRARTGTPIVPFGAGSGVCGGTLPIRGGIVVDLKRMRAHRRARRARPAPPPSRPASSASTSSTSSTAAASRSATSRRRSCARPFGGWLAARSAGQLSTKYGKIEDMVPASHLRRRARRDRTPSTPTARAPDWSQLLRRLAKARSASSRARRLHASARSRDARCIAAGPFRASPPAARRSAACCSAACAPRCVRLYDELDSFLHRGERTMHDGARAARHRGRRSSTALAMLTADGGNERRRRRGSKRARCALALTRPELVNKRRRHAVAVRAAGLPAHRRLRGRARPHRGRSARRRPSSSSAPAAAISARVRAGAGSSTATRSASGCRRCSTPARSSTRWRWPPAGTGCSSSTARCARRSSPLAFIMAHFSHAYADGCSIYFTFAARGDRAARRRAQVRRDLARRPDRRRRGSARRSATTTASACRRRRSCPRSTARRWRSIARSRTRSIPTAS